MRSLSADDVLSALGLQRRRTFADSVLPIASGFAAGALAGAAVALLFAPKEGREFRRQIKGTANDVTRRVGAAADDMIKEVRNALPIGEKEEQPTPPRPAIREENGERKPMPEMSHTPRFSPPPK
jgi:hypothetical protein